VVQRWHFEDGIGAADKRREERMRAMSGRRRRRSSGVQYSAPVG